MNLPENIEVKNLDHLGIIAGIIDELEIVEIINSKIGIEATERINAGQIVKAIIINGLGFVSRPLYLFSQFFQDNVQYKLSAILEEDADAISENERRAGRFILATNILDEVVLTPEEILSKYKEQQSPERGFRFLKDPLFFADSVFLKSPERIETMAMLMGLCLLVYTLGQRQLRRALKQCNTGIKNQLGKLTDTPTLRWIFQCFQGVHVVKFNGEQKVVNLTDDRWWILSFFPDGYQRYYYQ